MIQLSFCRVGSIPGARWYTKNVYLGGFTKTEQKLLAALNIKPPYKAQYIIEVRAEDLA